MTPTLEVKIMEPRILIVCRTCGLIGYFRTDQEYEAADALESHMFEFPDHAVKSAVREVEI